MSHISFCVNRGAVENSKHFLASSFDITNAMTHGVKVGYNGWL